MHHPDFNSPPRHQTDRQTIYRLFEEGRLDENAATARLLALDMERRHIQVETPETRATN